MATKSGIKEVRFLEKRKVVVKPVIRPGKWGQIFEDDRPNQPLLFPGAKKSYTLPNKEGQLVKVSVLDSYEKVKTPDYEDLVTEQEFFERKLFKKPGELSIYNTESRFWTDFRIILTEAGAILDLSDPMDMLRYKVLLACKNQIAPNFESRFHKGSYEFMIVDQNAIVKNEQQAHKTEDDATIAFLKIKSDPQKMRDVLKIRGLRVSDMSNDMFVESELRKFSKDNPKAFLDIIDDPNFELKVMIRNAVKVGALEAAGGGIYALPGGVRLGTEKDTIEYLEDPENAGIKMRIINQIESAK